MEERVCGKLHLGGNWQDISCSRSEVKVTTDMYRYALGWELEKIYPLYISFIHMKSHVVHVYDKSLVGGSWKM